MWAYLTCHEWLSRCECFEICFSSLLLLFQSEHNYYAFSSAKGMEELLEVVAQILGEEKKLRVEQNKDKWRIRAESRELILAVQLFTITANLRLVDFKKLRGSALGESLSALLFFSCSFQSLRECTGPRGRRHRSGVRFLMRNEREVSRGRKRKRKNKRFLEGL